VTHRSLIRLASRPIAQATLAALAALLVVGALCGCTTAETSPPLGTSEQPISDAPIEQSAPESPEDDSGGGEEVAADEPDDPDTTDVPSLVVGTVARVVDGDTAHILIKGVREKVRFIGIDTPESTREIEPYGKAAAAHTAGKLAIGAKVWLETDAELRDRYGRLLAYVWLDKPASRTDAEIRRKMLNAQLAIDGYAQQMTFPPNVRYVEHFGRYVREAREANRGLWAGEEQSSSTLELDAGAAAAPAASPNIVVFVTRTGEKYHLDGCSSLRRSRIQTTLEQAQERGYEACKLCRPPQ
jgi:micrococcal nuclease